MDENKVSVIVPIYNVEKYLRQCIDSIINQTYQNLEIVLIDDGSTDNSGKIADEYASIDPRIIVFHKENEGVSIARNKGLDLCSGEYVLFVDSDDYIEKCLIQLLINKIQDFDMVFYGYNELYSDKMIIHKMSDFEKRIEKTEATNGIFDQNLYNGYLWNKFFKTSIIKNNKIKFNKNITMLEDMLFVTEYLTYCDKIKVIEECYYYYRMRKNSVVNSLNKKNIEDWFNAYILMYKLLRIDDVEKYIYNYKYMLIMNIIRYKKQINVKLVLKQINKKLNEEFWKILFNNNYNFVSKVKLCINRFIPVIYTIYIKNKNVKYKLYS